MTRRALVTGGSGFIGWWLVRTLLERGREVRVLDLKPPPVDLPGVEHIVGSITEAPTVRDAMADVQEAHHLAATPRFWSADPSVFDRVNHRGAELIFETALRAGVKRVVHISSATALANPPASRASRAPDDSPRLADPSRALGAYSRSKILAEHSAQRAAARGLPVVIATVTTPIGPEDRSLTPPTQLLLDLLRGRVPAMPRMPWLLSDVRDTAQGIALAAERGEPGRRYVLHGHALTTDSLLALIERISGRTMPARRIPYWLAWSAAAVEQGMSRLTRREPRATIESVRLARARWDLSRELGPTDLGLTMRPIEQSLTDAIAWLGRSGWIEPAPETSTTPATPPAC